MTEQYSADDRMSDDDIAKSTGAYGRGTWEGRMAPRGGGPARAVAESAHVERAIRNREAAQAVKDVMAVFEGVDNEPDRDILWEHWPELHAALEALTQWEVV